MGVGVQRAQVKYVQLRYVLQHHVYEPVVSTRRTAYIWDGGDLRELTDVVVEPEKGAAEFWGYGR